MSVLNFFVTGALGFLFGLYLVGGIFPLVITLVFVHFCFMEKKYLLEPKTVKQYLIQKIVLWSMFLLWPVTCLVLILLSLFWVISGYGKYCPY